MGVWFGAMEDLVINKSRYLMQSFWSSQRVLITGHTGFKGSWMSYWLHRLGAQICGISLEPNTNPNLFTVLNITNICQNNICDIRDREKLSKIINDFKPSIVFHLAAQPLVRKSYLTAAETFDVNLMGTVNLLDCLKDLNPENLKSIVLITTDKVYDNQEWCWAYRENDQLGGSDPYSASKAACELAAHSYRDSFFKKLDIPISTARAGNVIGGGDWSIDRLIPDMMRSWSMNQPVEIRNPLSIRSWQFVLEPIYGYLRLAEITAANHQLQGAFNFASNTEEVLNVKQMVELAKPYFKNAPVKENIKENQFLKESINLRIDPSKSEKYLSVKSVLTVKNAIEWTLNWYKDFYSGKDAALLCSNQIDSYELLINSKRNY